MTHFEQSQFLYLIGRLRSAAEGNSFCMATTNPDSDSWVFNWVQHYLQPNGLPDESKVGKVRYLLVVDDAPVFADTEKELADAYPDLCYITDNEGNKLYVPPLSFSVILGNIFDNPALIKSNPKYLSALKAQTEINRRRLLDGDWMAKPEGSNYFEPAWLTKLDRIPFGCIECRAWDLASSEPSDKNRSPDFTASIKMLKQKDGRFVIVGNYDPQTIDEKTQIGGKFRKRPGERDSLMLAQARFDGDDCTIVIPKDPSAAGESAFLEMSKMFTNAGFKVKKDPTPNNKGKLKRFEPFSSACQNGLVSIVESSFPNQITLQAYYKELMSFDGERSTSSRKDDLADATASAFNYLAASKTHVGLDMPTFSGSNNTSSDNTSNGFSAVDNMVSERGSLESLLDTSVPMRDPYINF